MDIKTLRTQRGWNQATLATMCGLKQSDISELESGKKPLSDAVAKKLADALGTQDYALKRGHIQASVKAMLSDVAKLSDADIRAALDTSSGREAMRTALKALDDIQRDATVAEPVRKSAERGLTRLSEQTTKVLKERGYLNDDLGRDSFGRKSRDAEEIQRDLYGRRLKKATGESR